MQDLERHMAYSRLLADVAQALIRSQSLRTTLQACAQAVVDRLDAAFARIWTLNPVDQVLELQASAGLYTHIDGPHGRVPVGKFKIGKIAQENEPHLTNDVPNDPRVSDQAWARREGMVSFAGYPLVIEDKVVGVLAMFARHTLGEETLQALAAVADAVALGIERKRSDDRSRLFERLVETSQEIIGFASAEGRTLYLNAAGRQLIQPPAADTPLGDYCLAPWDEILERVRAGASWVGQTELRNLASGELVPVKQTALPIFNDSGQLSAVATVAQDLREALAAEQARQQEEARRKELIAALERSNRDLDQFAYVASHDLKAPLRGIANLSQWLEEDLGDVLTEDTRQQMRLLRGRVHRLEALINGILSYSRAGREAAKSEAVDVGELLEEVVELLARPAHLSVQLDPMPVLHTERVQLNQVFLNLIGNALKYAQREIRIGVRKQPGLYEFFVQDDGPGIPPEFHERIWGIFQTLERRDVVESTGIGLAVVKKIVDAKGGRTWIESTAGQGATFWFSWPERA